MAKPTTASTARAANTSCGARLPFGVGVGCAGNGAAGLLGESGAGDVPGAQGPNSCGASRALGAKRYPQCLHTLASGRMVSAQSGHFLVRPCAAAGPSTA